MSIKVIVKFLVVSETVVSYIEAHPPDWIGLRWHNHINAKITVSTLQ